jgi:chloramphenicol 3-O-phosphotransferase
MVRFVFKLAGRRYRKNSTAFPPIGLLTWVHQHCHNDNYYDVSLEGSIACNKECHKEDIGKEEFEFDQIAYISIS